MENPSLGELLKQSREKKGLSIDDVVRIIRIQKDFLIALETENYAKLPERTYALGYFRSYAKFLEIENIEGLVATLDQTYYFERPRYSDSKGQVFLDDEYGVVNTFKKKFSGKHDEAEEAKEPHLDNLKKADVKFTPHERVDMPQERPAKKENAEEGGFSSHNKLIIVLCVFLFIFLFLGYKLLFSGSSQKAEDSVAEAVASSESKKIDSIIDNNYVVVENNKAEAPKVDNNPVPNTQNRVVNQTLDIKAQPTQEPTPSTEPNSINLHDGLQNNQQPAQAPVVEESAPVETAPKFEIRPWAKPTRNYQISIAFVEDVWIQIYKQNDPSVVYLDKVFKAGDIFDVPKVDNISMNVGNYRGIKILVDNQEIALTSPRRNSVVLNNIILEKSSLLEKYQ
ncbi:MAG: DUF4115 domain-containing protein [Alphaproteobacteria bacterium]|jgi:cytoskeletal protein RodZ|nr:DUF4115 domain-containing protein [Alphaproteobacteria bacterium]